jgi:hypothetical protein
MSNLVSIPTALCLAAPDIEALLQGRMVAVIPRTFINPGQQFALHPCDVSTNLLPVEQYYRSSFLPIARTTLTQLGSETALIKAWARCESCQGVSDTKALAVLSQLTIWTAEGLQEVLRQQQHIFLAYLRVYQLPQPIEVAINPSTKDKIGKFIGLPNSLIISESLPVLSDRLFTQRRRQLEKLEPPLHPELEELQSAIAQLSASNSAADELDQSIKIFLGWASNQTAQRFDSDLAWIQKIAEVGNSSDGQTFEKLVRRGLFKLGFRGSGLEPDSTGGAGGMDFYCETPYPMVGECKATKTEKVPDGTPAQLLKIGMNHLGKAQYDCSIKLIVAAGELTSYALRTATENQMNVIRPETLQRLVELQAQHKNSIDLLELKLCLQQVPFGLADDKVNSYIDKVNQDIKLRSQIVEAVKQLGESGSEYQTVEIRAHYNAVFAKEPTFKLDDQKVHDLLVELSSPLTGYLGRIKGSDGKSDRFYFLRELQVD